MSSNVLRLHLFGPLRLLDGDRPLNAAPLPKCASLLAYLALNRERFVPRKEIAFSLWPDDPEEDALSRLRRHLHELLGALPQNGEPWIFADRANLGLNVQAPWRIDVADFERAIGSPSQRAEAVALYEGDLVPELDEEWLEAYRKRYREQAANALEALVAQAWLEHDAPAAIAYARRLLRVDPFRENTVRRLMAMLQLTGDRAAALAICNSFVSALRDEIGADPMPETRAAFEAIKAGLTPIVFPNNLPAHLTPFLGREDALISVLQQLRDKRLVTLVGPGGAGKTRLALAAAAFAGATYEDGVYFIDLSGASEQRSVFAAFSMPFDAGAQDDPVRALAARFQGKRVLLIADNCEHVIDICGPFCERLLRSAPGITILATSRMPMRLHGEVLYEVPALNADEARALFLSRANPSEERDIAAVDAICAKLDGLPLAIELAAAAASPLLETVLQFSTRSGVERHRTLSATIEWSISLLGESDRRLFEALAPFTPTFTAHAAAAVSTRAPDSVAQALARLQEASVLQSVSIEGMPRFRMLDTIRAAAFARLRESEDCDPTQERHAQYFADLVLQAQEHLTSAQQAEWLAKLDAEFGNLDTALTWSLASSATAARGIRMALGLRRFWEFRGFYAHAEHWLQRALERSADDDFSRVEILATLGKLQVYSGDMRLALERCAQAEQLARACGDERGLVYTLAVRAYALLHRGDRCEARRILEDVADRMRAAGDEHGFATALGNIAFDDMHSQEFAAAKERYERALAIFERLGDRRQCGWMLYQLGRVALCCGDFTAAQELFERSIEIRRGFRDRRGIVETLCSLGEVALAQVAADRAEALFDQAYRLSREIGWRRGLAWATEGRAAVIALRGQAREAVRLIGTADAYRETHSLFIQPADRVAYEALIDRLRKQLGTPAFEEAAAWGRSSPIMPD
jgi:predicted ATPase/DNA-binding SARP family transcriptional activator